MEKPRRKRQKHQLSHAVVAAELASAGCQPAVDDGVAGSRDAVKAMSGCCSGLS